eukprot:3617318-Pyramimonas_sp.AAC.1
MGDTCSHTLDKYGFRGSNGICHRIGHKFRRGHDIGQDEALPAAAHTGDSSTVSGHDGVPNCRDD